MKRVSPQSILGQQGANLIERIVLGMKSVWRPLQIFDVGIDGEIEICDPTTGEATNTIVRVQAKATAQPFPAETSESFDFPCEQRDIDYWLRGNAPVILIVCRPATNEAYWVSIRDYFKDLSAQKSRRVHFDKSRDRFDVSCINALKQLALPRDSGVYFSPVRKSETLYTNLLRVESFSKKVFIADTDYRKVGAVWSKFISLGIRPGPEWMLRNKRIISFHDLRECPFDTICDLGTVEDFDAYEWADTNDADRKREFVQLLNLSLRQRARLLGLWFDKSHKYYYFPANKALKTQEVRYRSIKQWARREVFRQYSKKSDPTQGAFCRHSAFKGSFLRLDGDWYLEITPTYHFTSNGYREDVFRAAHLSGIKRLERNPAVLAQVIMWADYLRRPTCNLFSLSEYPFLTFGELARVEIETGLPDDVWYKAEEGDEASTMQAQVNQLGFIGL